MIRRRCRRHHFLYYYYGMQMQEPPCTLYLLRKTARLQWERVDKGDPGLYDFQKCQ
jgi:hypothetical protein